MVTSYLLIWDCRTTLASQVKTSSASHHIALIHCDPHTHTHKHIVCFYASLNNMLQLGPLYGSLSAIHWWRLTTPVPTDQCSDREAAVRHTQYTHKPRPVHFRQIQRCVHKFLLLLEKKNLSNRKKKKKVKHSVPTVKSDCFNLKILHILVILNELPFWPSDQTSYTN